MCMEPNDQKWCVRISPTAASGYFPFQPGWMIQEKDQQMRPDEQKKL